MIDWGSVNWSGVLPVLSIALGWLLNELGQIIRLRREDTRAIGRLLSDLLIIRRDVVAVKAMMQKLRELTEYSPREHLFFQIVLRQLAPPDAGFRARFEESVKSVMGVKPRLGLDLVLQIQQLALIETLKHVAAASDEAANGLGELMGHVEDLPRLDELIRKLAWMHGWRTWIGVRGDLKRPLVDLPEGLIEAIKREAEKARAVNGAEAPRQVKD